MGKIFKYRLVDVFAAKPMCGNQLAVFYDAKGLQKMKMQSIARELNLSETTFITPSKEKEIDAKVRIFTPFEELQFAGHPVLGSAYVIAEILKKRKRRKVKSLNIGVGSLSIEVSLDYGSKKGCYVTMIQPIPKFGVAIQDRGQAASAFGLDKDDIVGGGVVSNVLRFLIVEISDIERLKGAQLNLVEAKRVIERYKAEGIYLFCRYEKGRFDVRSRFFAPTLGVIEDPATGSAAGALGGYLSRIMKFPMELKIKIEQGVEISRPSEIDVYVACDRGNISKVLVSGNVIPVGSGEIQLA